MINATSNEVIIRMAMEPTTVRVKGGERQVLRPSMRGFCWAEFNDGEAHPISHPLVPFIIDQLNMALTNSYGMPQIYFEIVAPDARNQEGQFTQDADVTGATFQVD